MRPQRLIGRGAGGGEAVEPFDERAMPLAVVGAAGVERGERRFEAPDQRAAGHRAGGFGGLDAIEDRAGLCGQLGGARGFRGLDAGEDAIRRRRQIGGTHGFGGLDASEDAIRGRRQLSGARSFGGLQPRAQPLGEAGGVRVERGQSALFAGFDPVHDPRGLRFERGDAAGFGFETRGLMGFDAGADRGEAGGLGGARLLGISRNPGGERLDGRSDRLAGQLDRGLGLGELRGFGGAALGGEAGGDLLGALSGGGGDGGDGVAGLGDAPLEARGQRRPKPLGGLGKDPRGALGGGLMRGDRPVARDRLRGGQRLLQPLQATHRGGEGLGGGGHRVAALRELFDRAQLPPGGALRGERLA